MAERALKVAIIALLAISLLMLGMYVLKIPSKFGPALIHAAVGKNETTLDLGAIVTQIQELSRLETASMRIMHISTVKQSYGMVPDSLGGDSLTFLAVGEVIAGVDLSQVHRDDVQLTPDGVLVMRLPPPQILVTRIDNQQSRVLQRSTGVLRRADIDLETRARASAERGVRQEALNRKILSIASTSAEKKLADFLNRVGFRKVRFESPRHDARRS